MTIDIRRAPADFQQSDDPRYLTSVIDLVVSAVLMGLGMMMLPPSLVSLPFKLLLFVMLDGWMLVVGTLLTSYQ